MEFDINLESERGEVLATVGDPQNLLHRLLERSGGFGVKSGLDKLVRAENDAIVL
jgi:hypothetical protein